jgi:hypothetical protein
MDQINRRQFWLGVGVAIVAALIQPIVWIGQGLGWQLTTLELDGLLGLTLVGILCGLVMLAYGLGGSRIWHRPPKRQVLKAPRGAVPTFAPTDDLALSKRSTCMTAKATLEMFEPFVDRWEKSWGRPPQQVGVVPGYGPAMTWRGAYIRDYQLQVDRARVNFNKFFDMQNPRLDDHWGIADPVAARGVANAIRDLMNRAGCPSS